MSAPTQSSGQKSPQNSERGGRLAIIAGRGQLPLNVAYAAVEVGETPFIFRLQNEADQDWSSFDGALLHVGDFAHLRRVLSQEKIGRVVMAGGVRKRPQMWEIRPSWNTIFAVPSILKKVISGGDDALLRGFIELVEAQGCKVLGAHEIVPNLVSEIGNMGKHQPYKASNKDISTAIKAALMLGQLDIGQGAVSVGGRVVALEGLEGTDKMLERVTELRKAGRLPKNKKGVLVKFCKPGQDMRADLPTIGSETILKAKDAGLAGIAVEAGRSFILDREKTIELADEKDMFLLGATRDGV